MKTNSSILTVDISPVGAARFDTEQFKHDISELQCSPSGQALKLMVKLPASAAEQMGHFNILPPTPRDRVYEALLSKVNTLVRSRLGGDILHIGEKLIDAGSLAAEVTLWSVLKCVQKYREESALTPLRFILYRSHLKIKSRLNKFKKQSETRPGIEVAWNDEINTISDPTADPNDELILGVLFEQYSACLISLPVIYREPIILFNVGHSAADIAARLNISNDCARMRLYRGNQILMKKMNEFGYNIPMRV
jgi:DNA-directed RNA polymerase specialized sigma24 family protein